MNKIILLHFWELKKKTKTWEKNPYFVNNTEKKRNSLNEKFKCYLAIKINPLNSIKFIPGHLSSFYFIANFGAVISSCLYLYIFFIAIFFCFDVSCCFFISFQKRVEKFAHKKNWKFMNVGVFCCVYLKVL